MEFTGRHIFLAGNFDLVPKRVVRRRLRAVGAVVVRHATLDRAGRTKARIDAVVVGSGLEAHESQVLHNWGRVEEVWSEAELLDSFGLELDHNQRLERLRDLLSELDAERWYQICLLLEGCPPGDGLEMAVDYVYAHTHEAPVSLLGPLPRWVLRAASGADERRLRCVRRLEIGGRNLSTPQLKRLVSSADLVGVEQLDLCWSDLPRSRVRHMEVNDQVATALAANPAFSNLVVLDLRLSFVSDSGARRLASSEHLQRLETIVTIGSLITPKGIELLKSSKQLPMLIEVSNTWR